MGPAELGEPGLERGERRGHGAGQHDDVRRDDVGSHPRRGQRRPGPEVAGAPAGALQHDVEGLERDVVELVGRAGEQGQRTAGRTRADRQRREPRAHQVGGEVLVGDVDRARLPAVADPQQERQHDVADRALHRHPLQDVVEHAVHGRGVVADHGREQRLDRGARDDRGGVGAVEVRHRRRGAVVSRAESAGGPVVGQHLGRRLGGGHAAPPGRHHRPHPVLVLRAVEPVARGGARRLQEAVAGLPRAQQRLGDPDPPGQDPDPPAVGRLDAHRRRFVHAARLAASSGRRACRSAAPVAAHLSSRPRASPASG